MLVLSQTFKAKAEQTVQSTVTMQVTCQKFTVGHPNRTERYGQYETMDIDSEINAALDILAEFCTQTNTENGTGFDIHFHETPTESEIDIIKKQLTNWNNSKRLWYAIV